MSTSQIDGAGERSQFPAQLAMLPATAAFTREFCDRHGIGHDDALRLTLLVEELFSNTMRHGHGGDSDAPIHITLSADERQVTLLYEDTAPPFNPLEQSATPPASLDATINSRGVGGLGVHLLFQLASNARYAYEQGTNRLWLTMERSEAGPLPARR